LLGARKLKLKSAHADYAPIAARRSIRCLGPVHSALVALVVLVEKLRG
jgi:hypothetical protein